MSFWNTLAKIGGVAAAPFTGGASLIPTALEAGGKAFGAMSQSQAQNRGAKLGAQSDLERLLMQREGQYQDMRVQREQEGRAGGMDAWRRLLMAQRVMSPGARPQLSPYSVAPRQATDMERQGADAMTREVMARLMGGNPIPQVTERPLEVDRRLMDPSKTERWLGYLGAGMTGAGGLMRGLSAPRVMTAGDPYGDLLGAR